jgi:type IV secretory pathway VirJ component
MNLFGIFRVATVALAVLSLAFGGVLLGRSALSTLSAPTVVATSFDGAEFGKVNVVHSDGPVRGLVILAADPPHSAATSQDALALAKAGLVAVSFDLHTLNAALAKSPSDDDCHYVSDDLKDLAQTVQRELGLKQYFFPIVSGRGDGSAFAFAALAQAPANTLGGAISIGFEPILRSDRTYCFEPGLDAASPGLFALRNDTSLPGPWRVIAPESERHRIETFQGPQQDQAGFIPAQDDDAARQDLVDTALQFGPTGERGHSALPLSLIRPQGPVQGLAVIISGDGGWRDIDKSIGEWLAQRGIIVVGLDSLRYFWSKKSAADVAADLALLLDHYGSEFGTQRYVVIGYSFGADVMPKVWPLLPKSVRDRIALVSLLGLGKSADFEVTVEGFVGATLVGSDPIAPYLSQLPLDRTQCIYGTEEAANNETSCISSALESSQRIALEGGHHFDGDYAKAAEAIWTRLKTRNPQS